MDLAIVAVADHPRLIEPVAAMLWQEFGRERGRTVADAVGYVRRRIEAAEPCFALLAGGEPVGTASLVAHDLDARPELTPWLASLCVRPEARGRGYASLLVKAVECAARASGIATLWLYTWSAPTLYAGLGWATVGAARDGEYDVVVMRRDFGRSGEALARLKALGWALPPGFGFSRDEAHERNRCDDPTSRVAAERTRMLA